MLLEIGSLHKLFYTLFFEGWSSSEQTAFDECMRHVDHSSIVLVIAGLRYGSLWETSGRSVSHEEYLRAKADPAKLVYVYIQEDSDNEREPRQLEFVQELSRERFRTSFKSEEGLKLQIERTLRNLHEGILWTPNSQDNAEMFVFGVIPELKSYLLPQPVFLFSGYPACARRELVLPDASLVGEITSGDNWASFLFDENKRSTLSFSRPTTEGYDIWRPINGGATLAMGRLQRNGAAVFASAGLTANSFIEGYKPVDPAEADSFLCYPQNAQRAIFAGTLLLGQWWQSSPRVVGQAFISWALTDTTTMMIHTWDPRGPLFIGPSPQGEPGMWPPSPGKPTISGGVWTSVHEVIHDPANVARNLIRRLWHSFHYPDVVNWIEELRE